MSWTQTLILLLSTPITVLAFEFGRRFAAAGSDRRAPAAEGALVQASVVSRVRAHPLANPVLLAVVVLALVLVTSGVSYDQYFAGARPLHFMLGPSTVALAVPLVRTLPRLRAVLLPLVVALVVGSATAILSVALVARALGASRTVVLSLAPKSATTPIAMGISAGLGGTPSLTAVFAVVTGIFGAVVLGQLLRTLAVTDSRAIGLAAGTAAHGLGTAHVARTDETAGAVAALAIGANGVSTALLTPPLVRLLGC